MFELKIADLDASSGTVPVSWCVDHETLKLLSDRNVEDPQVVIVVSPTGSSYHSSKEYRKVVPLKDLITYIEFRSSGTNKVWGFISLRPLKDANNRYLTRDYGDFKTDILSYDGNDWSITFQPHYNPNNVLLNSTPLTVEVPKQCFAKEPWAWEKAWVNAFFRTKCIDQCDFRRRRIFAYTIQPILMFFNIMVRLLILLVSAAVGARNCSIQPVIHPFRYSIGDAQEIISGGSIFIRQLPEDSKSHWDPDSVRSGLSYLFRSFYLLPLMPIVSIPLVLLTVYHHWMVLLLIGAAVIGGLIIFSIVTAILTGTFGLFGKQIYQKLSALNKDEDSNLWYMQRNEMDLLVCNTSKKPLTLASLPSNKKTMRLRFLDLKAKVCKPFSVS